MKVEPSAKIGGDGAFSWERTTTTTRTSTHATNDSSLGTSSMFTKQHHPSHRVRTSIFHSIQPLMIQHHHHNQHNHQLLLQQPLRFQHHDRIEKLPFSSLFSECDQPQRFPYSRGRSRTPPTYPRHFARTMVPSIWSTTIHSVHHQKHHRHNNHPLLSLPVGYATSLVPPVALGGGGIPAITTTSSMSLLKFLLVFTAGGLFFSTAIAAVTAAYAIGLDNVSRIWQLVRFILKTVWTTFTVGLRATQQVLLQRDDDESLLLLLQDGEQDETITKKKTDPASSPLGKAEWKWREAWSELKKQLGETKRTAAQGVNALRQEAKLYRAALGPPGLVPLQYVVDRLMPWSLSSIMEETLRNALADFPKQRTIKKMTLASFSAGARAPVFQAARVYDVPNALAFDYSVKWDSELDASVQIYTAGGLARVPVTLKNMKFEGTVRVILCPLVKDAPGYGAILMSFTTPPKINMDIRVLGGELTKLPFLKREITLAIQKGIADSLLWPRRTVIPSFVEGTKRTLLTATQLADLEKTDPLLEAENALAKDPMLRSLHDTTIPMEVGRMFRLSDDTNSTDTPEELEALMNQPQEVETETPWYGLKKLFQRTNKGWE